MTRLRFPFRAPGCTALLLAAAGVLRCGAAAAQALPPTAPTALPQAQKAGQNAGQTPGQTSGQTPPPPKKLSQAPPTPATITFGEGRLTIVAENASLNQILREIADETGMKITGGVSEERVFGSYGPAPVGTVLNQLLDGAGSNVLLVEDAADMPRELVLTPRNGGATPPSPMSEAYRRPERRRERDAGPRIPPASPVTATAPHAPVPAPTPGTPAPGTPAAPAAKTTTQQSPNGVKTPEQVFEQLLQMQQAQQKSGATPPPK